MKRFTATVFTNILAAALLIGCAANPGQTDLAVRIGQPVRYKSPNGDAFEARYGSLSDESLHFVKVTMPDDRQYTLPQVLSASGVRYSDDRELVWWTHQGTVMVETRNADGNWETKYPELREVPEQY